MRMVGRRFLHSEIYPIDISNYNNKNTYLSNALYSEFTLYGPN